MDSVFASPNVGRSRFGEVGKPRQPLKVLVTGASGFVGGALWKRLLNDPQYDVRGISRTLLVHESYQVCDLNNAADMATLASLDWTPDVVVHAAACTSQWGTVKQYRDHNVLATKNIIEYCRLVGSPRLIYVSTTSVFYRAEHQHGLTERSEIGPEFINLYAQTKYEGEMLVQKYSGEWVILRPRGVFGPGDTTLLPRIVDAAHNNRLSLIVDRQAPAIGDLIYIDTLVDYLIAAINKPEATHQAINLTNGAPVNLSDLIVTTMKRLDAPAPRRTLSVRQALALATFMEAIWRTMKRRGEPPLTQYAVVVLAYSKTFNISLAQRILGPPSVSMSEGFKRMIAWQRQGEPDKNK